MKARVNRSVLLVGSAESGGLAVCRSLGRAGHRVSILRLERRRAAADHSRYCTESLFIGRPEAGVSAYIAGLEQLLRERRFDYVMATDELALAILGHGHECISALTRIIGPSPSALARACDAFAAVACAQAAGLVVPEMQRVEHLGEVPDAQLWPVVVRPARSCAIVLDEPQRYSTRLVGTRDQLDAKLRDDQQRVGVFLHRPLSGSDVELSFCALDGELLGAAVSRVHQRAGWGEGVWLRSTDVVSPRHLAIMRALAGRLGWTGILSIACKSDGDRLAFDRFILGSDDGVSASILAGADLPSLLLDGLEGSRPAAIHVAARTIHLRNLRSEFGGLAVSARRRGRALAVSSWLVSLGGLLRGAEHLDVEQVTDPMPAFRQFDRIVADFGRKLMWRAAARLGAKGTTSVPTIDFASKLLIVCQGNINRSVVAEHLLRARGYHKVRSAGLLPMSGRRASGQAERFLAEERGIAMSAFRSQSVDSALRREADVDVVFCFERWQQDKLAQRYPRLQDKIHLITALSGAGAAVDILDPHGAAPEVYARCFRQIEELVDGLARMTRGTLPEAAATGDVSSTGA
jgi:protein-tyrosine-phosphatase